MNPLRRFVQQSRPHGPFTLDDLAKLEPQLFSSAGPRYMNLMNKLATTIRSCRLCADDFADTATAHCPRPVVWLSPQSRILVAGQAPGARVHASGKPFTDPSGERLRQWMGVSEEEFYDLDHVSILPTSFCFPGYDAKGSDLPPPPVCAETWHFSVMEMMPNLRLKLLVGAYAQKWHLGRRRAVTEVVRDWRSAPAGVIPLPHPSWRNTAWLKKNPWFEAELVPELRRAVRALINE